MTYTCNQATLERKSRNAVVSVLAGDSNQLIGGETKTKQKKNYINKQIDKYIYIYIFKYLCIKIKIRKHNQTFSNKMIHYGHF